MQLKTLRIHNIASIEDAEISFDSSPLSDSEVYLIAGKTGSGKTTILDAICLALYADTPRLNTTKMEGTIREGSREVQVYNPAQLLRRNTVEGSVTLSFKGNNDIDYVASWSVTRARKRVDGTMNVFWCLTKRVDGHEHTFTRDREITSEIEEAIGLSFEQFCRTTMLAQGDFSKFLNSKDEEKAEILEKLTGVDIYSRIGIKIFQLTKEKREAWERVHNSLNGIMLLNAEQIQEINDEINGFDKSARELKTKTEECHRKINWLKRDTELQVELKKKNEELETAIQAVLSDDFRHKENILTQWNETQDVRRNIEDKEQCAANLEKAGKELTDYSITYASILEGLQYEKNSRQESQKDLSEVNEKIDAESSHATTYENVTNIELLISNLNAATTFILEEKEKITQAQKEIAETRQPRAKELEKNITGLQKQLKENDETRIRLEESLAKMDHPGLNRKRETVESEISNLKLILQSTDSFFENAKEQKKRKQTLEDDKSALNKKKQYVETLEKNLQAVRIRAEQAKVIYDAQKDSIENFAIAMRAKLHPGDSCPVCRQRIREAIQTESEIEQLVKTLENSWREADKNLRDKQEELNKEKAEINASQKKIDATSLEIQYIDTRLANKAEELRKRYKESGLETGKSIDEALILINEKITEKSGIKDSIKKTIATAEDITEQVAELRKRCDSLRKETETTQKLLSDIQQQIEKTKNHIETSRTLITRKDSEIQKTISNLAELIADNRATDWKQDSSQFLAELKRAAGNYKELLNRKNDLEGLIARYDSDILKVEKVIEQIHALMPEWKEIAASSSVKTTDLDQKALTLVTDVSSIKTKIKGLHESERELQHEIDRFMEEHPSYTPEILDTLLHIKPETISRYNDEITTLRNNELKARANKTTLEESVVSHQNSRPQFNENESISSLETDIQYFEEQIKELSVEIGRRKQQLDEDSKNHNRFAHLRDEADELKKEYDRWDRLNNLIGDSSGKKFKKIAQSYILESLLHSANHYMNTLSGRYRLLSTPGQLHISIEDAYQGFAVRSASTLSGGETFLVSLSLALALSDIGEIGMDTLFIDEGFGTLSGEPLQKAIETLRALHSKTGKHVGIISHVEELREKIPVQIRVDQTNDNSCSSIRVIP